MTFHVVALGLLLPSIAVFQLPTPSESASSPGRCVDSVEGSETMAKHELSAQIERLADLRRANVVRLPLDAFPEAPEAVRRALREMGCRIPQTYYPQPRHNLISGRFLRAGELHWAALCSRDEATGLLLLAADGTLVEEVAPFRSDADHLQGMDIDGTPGFNWAIDTVGREYILEHHARYGGPEPPPIDHDGINSAVVERASTVLYWHGGEWLELTGAD